MRYFSLLLIFSGLSGVLSAAEPNETFATATVLAPGVFSVNDSLTAIHPYPDTFLGIRSAGGSVTLTDDDTSLLGNGFASGLQNVAVDQSTIRFAVTGYQDPTFIGAHSEVGEYDVFVNVRNLQGSVIDSFSERRTLSPTVVHEFLYSNENWAGGNFSINIENRTQPNDIDFFTFTGLVPHSHFAARTMNPSTPLLDTILGWYSDSGERIGTNDDYGVGRMSRIFGIVPASGMLTFAVTGFGDSQFGGYHSQVGDYTLLLEPNLDPVPGDYNGDRLVNAADYVVWRNARIQTPPNLAADGTQDGMIDHDDYAFWKLHYGEGDGGVVAASATQSGVVPEPSTALLTCFIGLALCLSPRRRSASK